MHLADERRDVWNPDQYQKFRDQRAAPFLDLLAMVEPPPARSGSNAGVRGGDEPGGGPHVLDLGCGTGELTRLAHDRLQARETIGLDSSPAMLSRAAVHAGGGVSFQQGDLAAFEGGRFDVVLSNAAVHWVPDHEALLPRLLALVAPGGQIAVQAPANDQHPSHAVAREVAREAEFAARLGGFVRESPLLEPEAYSRILFRNGFARQRVRLEVYAHPLASREEVVEWVRGTTLTDYEKRLDAPAFERFLARYRERLMAALPDERPFLYTFRRLFVWGRR